MFCRVRHEERRNNLPPAHYCGGRSRSRRPTAYGVGLSDVIRRSGGAARSGDQIAHSKMCPGCAAEIENFPSRLRKAPSPSAWAIILSDRLGVARSLSLVAS